MERVSSVTKVLGVATKKDGSQIKGQGKNGSWTMFTCILDNGIKLNLFGPVKEGDIVFDLTKDEKFGSWSGKVKKAGDAHYPNNPDTVRNMSEPTNAQLMEATRKTYALLLEVHKLLKGVSDPNEVPYDQNQKPDPGKGANRDYAPTADEVQGEPYFDEIPFK